MVGIKQINVQSDTVPFSRCWDGKKNVFNDAAYQIVKGHPKPDIVHIQHEFGFMDSRNPLLDFFGTLSAHGIPVVVTPHTVMEPKNEKAWFFTDILSKSVAIVAHTEATKEALLKWAPLKDIGIYVISHGTPEDCEVKDVAASRRHLYLPEDPNLVVAISLGFITPGKMQHEAVEAIIELVKDGLIDPNRFLYIIAGEPGQGNQGNIEYCLKIHRMIDQARAWNYIRINPGFVSREELPFWYGAADFVITGSHQTFFSTSGRSHQEMAFGMPSVSSNARLLSDLNEMRSLKYESHCQLRARLLQMINDPNIRSSLSSRCVDFAKDTSWTNVAKKHMQMYDAIKLAR
jgi:glycosyltransferase involved in cell wall biosynthesis